METTTTPEIFVFSLEGAPAQSVLNDVHKHLMHALAAKVSLKQATTSQSAMDLFNENPQPLGVLVTDPKVFSATNDAASQKLVTYVRSGGILVLGGTFSTQIRPSDFTKYIKDKFDLPWEAGSYHRTTLFLNQEAVGKGANGLPTSYDHKALFLKYVDPGTSWYVASDRSRIESVVPLPGPGIDLMETSVALVNVGSGQLGYIGDVNGEDATTALVLEMFGLN